MADDRRKPRKILAAETEPPRSTAYPWLRSNGKGHQKREKY
jgi:hypothetical protein